MKEVLKHYQKIFQEEFEKINFIKFPSELYEPIDYALKAGGKRLRPTLTIMACDFYANDYKNAINPAIAIETFHNFTLLHDDIMDNAPIRRGLPTVYNKYGTNTAILSGDTMFTKAYEYVTYTDEQKLPLVLKVFNQTAREVCEGQQLDMNFETIQNISREQYMEMIHLKTAVLIGACLKIGAILGNAPEKYVDAIYEFGLNTGMIFQLQDDLLDTFGDEKTFGKRIGGDILDCKKTFLYVVTLENLPAEEKDKFIKTYSDKNIVTSQKIKIITDFYNKANVMEECKKIMLDYHEKALKALPNTGLKAEQQQILKEIAESMLVRNL